MSDIELIPHKNAFLRFLTGTWLKIRHPSQDECKMVCNHEFFLCRVEASREDWVRELNDVQREALRVYYTDKWTFDSNDFETEQYMKLFEALCVGGDPRNTVDVNFLDNPPLPFSWKYAWMDLTVWAALLVMGIVLMLTGINDLDDGLEMLINMYQKRKREPKPPFPVP